MCRSLVAGVNMTMRAETTAVLSKAGMLTLDGRCKTLDGAADGYVRGEACVVHLLEAVTAEELAGGIARNSVVVHGTAVNQDGRSSSLTAPNGPSQQQVRYSRHATDKRQRQRTCSVVLTALW